MRRIITAAAAGALAVSGLGAMPSVASAAPTITVRPGQSIQAAVDRAAPGTRIVILPGTYHEAVDVTKDGLTLQGSGPATRVVPPARPKHSFCQDKFDNSAFCILGKVNPSTLAVLRRVRDVTVTNLSVSGFSTGVFAYGTRNLTYVNIWSSDNEEYGIARFDSVGGQVITNRSWGNGFAGIYIGDSQPANVFAAGNASWDNFYGFYVRHVRGVDLSFNTVYGNCDGIFVENDGGPGGAGDAALYQNVIRANNKNCPGSDGEPGLSGGGILLLGTDHVTVVGNAVNGNRGRDLNSGGLVLLSGTGLIPGVGPVTHTLVRNNTLFNNAPDDIRVVGGGTGNVFQGNRCRSSSPNMLCFRG